MLIQIYGVTTAEDASAVAELGPDHVGVVVDEGIDTWDSVDEATARTIIAKLRGLKVVALSLSTDPARITRTVEIVEPQILHLARAAGNLSAEMLAELRRNLAPIELMVTVPVRGPESLDVARRLAPSADYLLLDTVDPASGVIGATGHTHNWNVSAAIVAAVDVPVFLAGGLGPHNVAEAIERVRPAGVDSETRTSRDEDRRRKDPEKV
ncbi:MAG: phosphoribosylanthranilate isomerase, partial [Actinomycetota bacterium]|nr:phosphoribosylanthranilate isomerase [Actinomycetota bacterium]